jgi:hypothetical protein
LSGKQALVEVNWLQLHIEGRYVLNNLTLIALFLIVLWLAAIGYYVYTSRQQNSISREIDELKEMLGDEDKPGEG